MGILRRKDALPYDMFDLAKEAYDAKTGKILSGIYHRGQDRAWSGVEVLPMLIEKHGVPALPQEQREALARVFAVILWGELAAWKISAQLAVHLVPLEARMAATSQAHDEARHFYTMYDYLKVLGTVPENIDRRSERVLDLTLGAKNLAHKMCGMQLMIETIALTIFQTVRKSQVEPVLSDLLRYFELDEARHVALGVNYLPSLIKEMSRFEIGQFMVFQVRLMFWVLYSMHALQEDLKKIGVHPTDVIELGKAKQMEVLREMWGGIGVDIMADRPIIGRIFDAANEIWFPREEAPLPARLRRAASRFASVEAEVEATLMKEAEDQFLNEQPRLEGMGDAGSKWWKRREARRAARS